MRHRISQKKLNRTSEHRKALHRNLAQSLIEHGRVTTTIAKAKDIRPYVERLITLAVRVRKTKSSDPAASLRARRRIHKMLGDRSLIPADHQAAYEELSDASRRKTMRMSSGRRYRTGEPRGRLAFTGESVIHRLIEKVASRFEDRDGGYTRLIRTARVRKGDNSPLAVVQLLGDEEVPSSLSKPPKTARRRRTDRRYAFAIKAGKGVESSTAAAAVVEEEPVAPADEEASVDTPEEADATPDSDEEKSD